MTDVSNMKLVKMPTMDYGCAIIAQVALDHLKAEYQKNIDTCTELELDPKHFVYWTEQIAKATLAYEQLSNGKIDLVDIEPAS
jgi:hypothetical protein